MEEAELGMGQDPDLLVEIAQLRHEVARLTQANSDLQISLATTSEHGDLIEFELHKSNQRLQAEIAERKLAQATLQEILETVTKDKVDLELILQTTTEHGDAVGYELYTHAVETMRQSEELFRAISESTSILMLLLQSSDGVITYANSASGQRLGVDPQALLRYKLKEFFVNPKDSDHLQELLAAQGSVSSYEMEVKTAEGRQFWVSTSVHPVQLSHEQLWLVTLFDISDRKQIEASLKSFEDELRQQALELERRVEERTFELRQTEEKYRSLFENAVEGIFQIMPDGHYLSVNPALAEMYGYESVQELMASVTNVGQQLYVQPHRRGEIVAYLRQFGSVAGFESEVHCKDGTVIWISENIRTIQDQQGNLLHYEGSVRNITERKLAEAELRAERMMAERLLLNVLPQSIAQRLKQGEKTISDSFSSVTVLFADIVNFTELSTQISPSELIELLNTIFSTFDKLADRRHLEKIKTIGDAYMVVGGLPTPRPDHTVSIADMALDMLREVRQFHAPDGSPIMLRVGIHTGPVIAGVIGTRKFSYDLWGDTVNVASRMEASGEPGHVQVTQTVFDRLKVGYKFQKRGETAIKGKGFMTTYWLTGKRLATTKFDD